MPSGHETGISEQARPALADHRSPDSSPIGWIRSLLWVLGFFVVYSANGRPIGGFDTMPAVFLPVAMIRGDGPFLDRFASVLQKPDGALPLHVNWSHGHIVSRYPIAPAILAVPLELPQVLILDWLYPGWEQDTPYRCLGLAKNAAAAIAAIEAVVLLKLLRMLGLGRMAVPTVLAAALGSNLWTVASQSLWEHGPAALALTLSMLLLVPCPVSRPRLFLAGLTTATLVAFRAIDVVFAAVILLWVLRFHTRNLAWFLPVPILGAGALIGYNYWYFGTIAGGQAQLEALHPEVHGLEDAWSGNWLEGAVGTLLSPSHGLFVFTPWIALALAMLPVIAVRLKPWPLVCWLLWAIVPYFLLISKYAVWWGGHCFGPRYWTDAVPLFAILLGFGLEWSRIHSRPILLSFALIGTFSLGVQLIGAFCYPSTWETSPVDVDFHHERLWDWRDHELFRCLTEGMK